ncbi:MAG: 3D domain-containing protein [Candidatus Peribacteraceae bacterium]|nr:3D domain-containing protein [Candidatus Peribacteraceae bacterium]
MKVSTVIVVVAMLFSSVITTLVWDRVHRDTFMEVVTLSIEVKELTKERDFWIEKKDEQQELLDKMATYAPRVTVKVTAYSNDAISINKPEWRDGITASGVKAEKGVVAADWSVYPPGTVLFIPGYGRAIVWDRGSAVKKQHIDVFLPSRKEALEWGVKNLDIYVLEVADAKI